MCEWREEGGSEGGSSGGDSEEGDERKYEGSCWYINCIVCCNFSMQALFEVIYCMHHSVCVLPMLTTMIRSLTYLYLSERYIHVHVLCAFIFYMAHHFIHSTYCVSTFQSKNTFPSTR